MTVFDYTRPDIGHSALLTMNIQRDFALPDVATAIAGAQEILPALRRIVRIYRSRKLPIIHVIRLYLADGSNAELCRRRTLQKGHKIVCPGTDGAELMDELKPAATIRLDANKLLAGDLQSIGEHEWIMYKPRWGAFYNTPLEVHLRNLAINSLTMTGFNFPNSPRATILEASERDFRIFLVEDAVSALDEGGKQEMVNIGVHLIDTWGIINNLADTDYQNYP